MQSVILVIHLILALSIITVVLLQRSEGGGLGIGGGGLGDLAGARSTANALTRMTGILAACFMGTSLFLAVLAGNNAPSTSIMDVIEEQGAATEGSAEAGATEAPVAAENGEDAAKEAAAADTADEADKTPAAPISE